MNIMNKPKKTEVIEYFKNAKILDGLISKFDISTCLHTLEYSNKQYWVNDDGSYRVIWDKQLGYTKIISYKEPLYQLTAKEVVHAYENPQWLKDTFKECFETELEVSRWYKSDFPLLLFITEIRHHELVGYGFNAKEEYREGTFCTRADVRNKVDYDNFNFRPATEKEVEEALVKEAIKRGYKEGVTIKNHQGTFVLSELDFVLSDGKYNDGIWTRQGKGVWLFFNGVWAEIIQVPTYTITEAEEKFNIKIVEKNV